MRLQTSLGPDALYTTMRDPGLSCHRARAPMRRVCRHLASSFGQHLLLDIPAERRDTRWPCLVAQQAIDANLDIAFLPAPDARLRFSRAPHDLIGAAAISRRQHDPRPPDSFARAVAIFDNGFERQAVRLAHEKANVISSHAERMTDLRPDRNRMLGGEH